MKLPKSLSLLLLVTVFLYACKSDYGSGTKHPTKHEHEYGKGHDHAGHNHDHADNKKEQSQSIYDKIAKEYESEGRTDWQKPYMVVDRFLGDLEDKTVADIGAGPIGYFSFLIVSRAKKVIAIDIDKDAIAFMEKTKLDLPEHMQDRFEARLVKPDNPKLREKEADVVLIVNTITYIDNRIEYLKNLRTGLADGGKIVILDYKKRRLPVGPPLDEKLPLYQLELDLEKAGYTDVYSDDRSLEYQYVITAVK